MNEVSDNSTSNADRTQLSASASNSQQGDRLTKETAIEELFDAAGGFSYFQIFAFLCVQCAISCNNFWNNGLGFLIQKPAYKCTFTETVKDPDDVCTVENICDDDPRIEDSWVDWSDPDSLHNWQERLDLKCRPSWLVGTLGSAFFAGYVVTMMWLPRFADKKGRKPMYTLGMILNAVVYTVMMI